MYLGDTVCIYKYYICTILQHRNGTVYFYSFSGTEKPSSANLENLDLDSCVMKITPIDDAFDTIYMSCIHNRSRNFLRNFFHLHPIMVAIVRSLPPEPAVLCTHALHEWRSVGPQLRAHSVGGTWAYLWLRTRHLVLLVCP